MSRFFLGALKAGLRQPYLALSRNQRRVVPPLMLNYAVTWRCNSRCVMCDIWKDDGPAAASPPELSLDEIQRIFTRDRRFLSRVKKLGLTGGEPFLRSDLPQIVEVLHNLLPQAQLSLVSNGLLPKRILEKLEEIRSFYPELIFGVSLDGLGPVHDEVRGVPGAYDKALATIKGAQELGFVVNSGMTISQHNYHQVHELADLLEGMGVDFSCNLQESGANFNLNQPQDLTRQQADQVAQSLARFPHHFYMDNLRRMMQGAKRTLPCYSGFSSYFVTPSGQVLPCNLIFQTMGELREQSFARIAASERAWKIRRSLKNCTCWSQCEVKNAATSAPFSVFKWWLANPRRMEFVRHYQKRKDQLPL